MRLIGLDVGESRIGVAVSDPLGKTAQPLETVRRDEDSVRRLAELAGEMGAEKIVVGLPLLLDGSEGKQAGLVRAFAEELEGAVDVPVVFMDERLTTRQAQGVLASGRVKRAKRREAADRIAAALILSGYMDGLPEG
ncbi:MAG TPA: Holliday junction resolvase RuvX [Candidatus Anoxymicrobiaceae bacterium]